MFPEGSMFPIPTTAAQRGDSDPDLELHTGLGSLAEIQTPIVGPTGVLTGTGESYVAGQTGNAISIPTFGTSAQIEYATGLTMESAGTIQFYFKPTYNSSTNGTEFPYFLCGRDGAATKLQILYDQRSGSKGMRFYMYDGSSTTDVRYNPTLVAGTWYKMDFIWNSAGIDSGSDTRRFYVDDVRESRVAGDLETDAISPVVAVLDLDIGNCNSTRGMKGTMDEFKYFSAEKVP
jgi:hypothetical protein